MRNLLRKELRLALHPAAVLFLGLSAMMLIPNYPLTVTFFYPCLGVFFICLSGRENRDVYYTALLPIEKRQVVRARVLLVGLLQGAQALLCVPFLFLRDLYPPQGNVVGLDANLALLGVGLTQMGLFDLVFFPRYYKDPNKVGAPFLLGTAALFVWAVFWEVSAHVIPFVRDRLDTPLFHCLPEKAVFLACCAALFAAALALASRLGQRRFERRDL